MLITVYRTEMVAAIYFHSWSRLIKNNMRQYTFLSGISFVLCHSRSKLLLTVFQYAIHRLHDSYSHLMRRLTILYNKCPCRSDVTGFERRLDTRLPYRVILILKPYPQLRILRLASKRRWYIIRLWDMFTLRSWKDEVIVRILDFQFRSKWGLMLDGSSTLYQVASTDPKPGLQVGCEVGW